MKAILFSLGSVFGLYPAPASNSAQDLKNYLILREQIKTADLATLKKIAANTAEKNVRRGISAYYVFLKTPLATENRSAARALIDTLETSANIYMDPLAFVKLAQVYALGNTNFHIQQDRTKALLYLSIAWEIADLSDRATGDNALLTLIVTNSLGIGDGLVVDAMNSQFSMQKALDTIRPDVLSMRQRFKRLYKLSVNEDKALFTNLERHYRGQWHPIN